MPHRTSSTHAPETEGATMPHWSRFYDLVSKLLFFGREGKFRRAILDQAEIKPGEAVLDVGCGTGTLALLAKERVGLDGAVHGIDATPGMIEVAQRKAEGANTDVDFQVGLIEELPFPDATFDLVLSSLMFHHLPEDLQKRGLGEIARALKPGGRLLVADFAAESHSLIGHLLPFASHGAKHDAADGLVALLKNGLFEEVDSPSSYGQFAFILATKGS